MEKFNFGEIDKIIIFGGGKFVLYATKKLIEDGYQVVVLSAERHLEENIEGKPFIELLEENGITFYKSEDINKDNRVIRNITNKTIGLSLGAAWIFKDVFIKCFNGKLINMHGTGLPQNRGGGNYSWMTLTRNRLGFCLMHQIDRGIDTGVIIKSKEFIYPVSCKIPKDYMEYLYQQHIEFFNEFLSELKQKKDFICIGQPEYLSTYWPRLNTYKHGFINWEWSLKDIECFINAFDEPYCGASTFIKDKRVFLKDCYVDYNDGLFHPFQTGIIYRKRDGMLFVAANEGTLIVKKAITEDKKNILNDIEVGDRFFTPAKYLEDAKLFKAIYTPSGLKENNNV